jgi:S1-C subfamily serine protease
MSEAPSSPRSWPVPTELLLLVGIALTLFAPPLRVVLGGIGVVLVFYFGGRIVGNWREGAGRILPRPVLQLVLALVLLCLGFAWGQDVPLAVGVCLIGIVLGTYSARSALRIDRYSQGATGTADDLFPGRFEGPLPLRAVVKVLSADGESTGFLVAPDGHLVTNAHCVMGAPRLEVVLANLELFPARVVATDEAHDVALLKIDTPYRLPAVRLDTRRTMRLGTSLATLGWEPWDVQANSSVYTPKGWVSAPVEGPVAAPGTLASVSDGDFAILATAHTGLPRPGYSGAPVCEARTGNVVGVHGGGYGVPNLGQVLPIQFVEDLIEPTPAVPCGNPWWWQLPLFLEGEALNRNWRGAAARFAARFFDRYSGPEDLADEDVRRELREDLDAYLERVPDSPYVWSIDAGLRHGEGDVEGARASARRAIEGGSFANPTTLLHATASTDAHREENLAVAEAALARLAALRGYLAPRTRTNLHRLRAASLSALGRWEACLQACDDAIPDAAEAGRSFRFRYHRAECLQRLERHAEAIEAYEAAMAAGRREDGIEEDWTGMLRAYLGEGSETNLRRCVDLAMWHFRRDNVPHLALPLGAEAAERLGRPEAARWMREMAEILTPTPPAPEEEAVPEGTAAL